MSSRKPKCAYAMLLLMETAFSREAGAQTDQACYLSYENREDLYHCPQGESSCAPLIAEGDPCCSSKVARIHRSALSVAGAKVVLSATMSPLPRPTLMLESWSAASDP
jgi:hypothetical protein